MNKRQTYGYKINFLKKLILYCLTTEIKYFGEKPYKN